MINARMMYLRPGNLFKDFLIEELSQKINSSGKPENVYMVRPVILHGCLADADTEIKETWKQENHPVTHIIVQRGSPLAKAGDRLKYGDRTFYIQGIDDMGNLGIATQYFVEERFDVK